MNKSCLNYAERTRTWLRRVRVGKITISFNSQNNDMMTGGAQARLRPSLTPFISYMYIYSRNNWC